MIDLATTILAAIVALGFPLYPALAVYGIGILIQQMNDRAERRRREAKP